VQSCTRSAPQSRDRRKALDLLAGIADAERIVGIDQVDDRRPFVDMNLQRLGRQPIVAGGIIDRNLDHVGALLAREQAGPFPGRIGGHERRARLAARPADHGKCVNPAFGHQRLGIWRVEIGNDRGSQHLEAQRRRIGVELALLNRADHGFAHRRVAVDVIGVLAEPIKSRGCRELIEITVADQRGGLRLCHHSLQITEPRAAMPPSIVTTVPVM
jgi:hypothetical protein